MGCGASTAAAPPRVHVEKPLNGEGSKKAASVMDSAASVMDSAVSAVDAAAAKVQALARGRHERTVLEDMHASATLMQARFRGKKARSHAAELQAEREVVREVDDAKVKRSKSSATVLAVNDWQFGKQLGKGAFGQVYKANKKGQPDDPVAVKVLSRSILKRKRVGRFGSAYDSVMGEISVMKRLDHPNIVRLYEVIDDPDEDLLFMIMECVPGGDLSRSVEEKRDVPEPELRVWMTGLILGLEHLHLCGVCHRDIKPENVLWDPREQLAKLSDFGISVFYKPDVGGDFFQSTGGSYPFFAPEMCRAMRGAGYSGRAADMWAVGVSLFMWLYHRMPYESDSVMNLMQKIANEEVGFPEDATHSPELLALLRGLLDRIPKQRLRIRDLRRDPWFTDHGSISLPVAEVPPNAMAVQKTDLAGAVRRVTLLQMAEGPAAASGALPEEEETDALGEDDSAAAMRQQIAAEAASEAAGD